MTLDYIYHSGFAIEAEGVTVIIDYYKDSSETEHNRGIVHDYLLQRPGKLYVLATHFHPDHFNREILTWKEARPDIRYIFSKDILKSHRAKPEDATYIKKGETSEAEIRKANGDFLAEVKYLKEKAPKIDLALFPVDRRMGKDYMKGAKQFIEQIKTTIFVPMHFSEDYEGGNALRDFAENAGCRFVSITHRGESFEITK